MSPLRIATWNCCRGPFAVKREQLKRLGADVVVVQECPRPPKESNQCRWFGDNPRMGIAVFAFGAYRLRRLSVEPDVPNYTIPVAVLGPVSFNMLAVWAKPNKGFPYVEAVVRAVELYAPLLRRSPALLLGDLNSNRIWDHEHHPTKSHSALVTALETLGLSSCYHAHVDEAHGEERTPTFHLHRKREKTFHLDYCFAPTSWLPRLVRVEVGSFEEWAPYSDHRPVVVEFA